MGAGPDTAVDAERGGLLEGGPERELHAALTEAAERDRAEAGGSQGGGGFAASAAGVLVEGLDDAGRRAAGRWFHDRLCRVPEDPVNRRAVHAVIAMRLGWTAGDVADLLVRLERWSSGTQRRHPATLELPLTAMESLSPAERSAFLPQTVELNKALPFFETTAAERAALRLRLDALAPPEPDDASRLPRSLLDDDDPYGPRMRAELGPLLASPGIRELLVHCASMDKPRATVKWRKEAARLAAAAPAAPEAVRRLLEGFAAQPEGRVAVRWSWGEVAWQRGLTGPHNTALVRGLLWTAAGLGGAWVVPLAGDCARYAGTGVGGSGGESRSGLVATAAVAVLGSFDGERGEQAVRALASVRAKVRNRTVLKAAERAQLAIAQQAGLTPAQLRERSVPTAGLDARRTREWPLADGYTAVLSLDAAGAAALVFRAPSGRTVRSTPKAVRDRSAAELAAARAALKDLRALLGAERTRVEECLAADARWSGADWLRLYADHPVTGAVAGALVWEVRTAEASAAAAAGASSPDGDSSPADASSAAGGSADAGRDDDPGGWTAGLPERDGAGWVLAGPGGTAAQVRADDTVRLWHPLRADPDDVRAWRTEVTTSELRQPFKQIFREVYLLTPAEEATAVYSNRFAAHILRLPQARALMAARGWSADHIGYWGDGYEGEAVRVLPTAVVGGDDWRATFHYQLVEQAEDGGVASLCATDQVRFERGRAVGGRREWRPADLAEVPPLTLSEMMRDIDLFTGVASIAADPQWQDRGEDRHAAYWRRVVFGALPPSAELRGEALAHLLPRTRIADRAEVDGRFLRVRGDLATYRIHLGSGNVLMEPNDAYLCIVPAHGRHSPAGRVFLPFEEDGGMLAVVLSKAFLLADDASITDPSITRQLPGRPLPA